MPRVADTLPSTWTCRSTACQEPSEPGGSKAAVLLLLNDSARAGVVATWRTGWRGGGEAGEGSPCPARPAGIQPPGPPRSRGRRSSPARSRPRLPETLSAGWKGMWGRAVQRQGRSPQVSHVKSRQWVPCVTDGSLRGRGLRARVWYALKRRDGDGAPLSPFVSLRRSTGYRTSWPGGENDWRCSCNWIEIPD